MGYRYPLGTGWQPARGKLLAMDTRTPELTRFDAMGEEQVPLAIVRYNRPIDTFLGLTIYSLQNHLHTTVEGIGQIEIDELCVGLD